MTCELSGKRNGTSYGLDAASSDIRGAGGRRARTSCDRRPALGSLSQTPCTGGVTPPPPAQLSAMETLHGSRIPLACAFRRAALALTPPAQ